MLHELLLLSWSASLLVLCLSGHPAAKKCHDESQQHTRTEDKATPVYTIWDSGQREICIVNTVSGASHWFLWGYSDMNCSEWGIWTWRRSLQPHADAESCDNCHWDFFVILKKCVFICPTICYCFWHIHIVHYKNIPALTLISTLDQILILSLAWVQYIGEENY